MVLLGFAPQLQADGEGVSKRTVTKSMARQGLVAPKIRRPRGLTRPDQKAAQAPDLLCRDVTAKGPDEKWCGDFPLRSTRRGPLALETPDRSACSTPLA